MTTLHDEQGRRYEVVEPDSITVVPMGCLIVRPKPAGREDAFWCSCGSGWAVPADEDGCCTSCGATLWTTADVLKCGALAAERERVARIAQEDMRARCQPYGGTGIAAQDARPWADIEQEAR